MTGVLVVLKPPGLTSHDVVLRIRRLFPGVRAGHTGTLDPEVSGVLPVFLGQATRLTQYVLDGDKEYRTEMCINAVSSTEDWTGEVSEVAPVPVTEQDVRQALLSFRGEVEQVPPMLSAIRKDGRRLYELHRRGETVNRSPRKVLVHDLRLVRFQPGPRPRALFDLSCSRGTYVRTLCSQIGARLGTGAYMSYLVRTKAGPFRLADSLTLEEISELAQSGELEGAVLPAETALAGMAEIEVDWPWAVRIRNGIHPGCDLESRMPPGIQAGQRLVMMDPDGALAAVAEVIGSGPAGYEVRLRQVFGRDSGANGGESIR